MKRKLLLATLCVVGALGGGSSLMAQTDVTSTYLTNADFDSGEGSGWTYQTSSGTHYHGALAYGTSDKVNNIGMVIVDKFGESGGKAFVTAAGWGTVSYYTQEVTLPAGTYKITFDVFNNRNTTGGTSRFGWVPNSGSAVYSTSEFTYDMWVTHSVSFTLDASTTGKVSIGVASVSGKGSGDCAHLLIDNVKIFKMDETPAATLANPIDYSDKIDQKTWSYDEDDGSGSASSLTTNVNKGAYPYRHAERYRGNSGHYGKKLYQTVSDLPAGVYQVKASCMSAHANNVEGTNGLADGTTNNAYFYANSEETTYALANATSAYQTQIVTLTEAGNIEFGVKTTAVGANWNAIGCATIVKLAESYSDYTTQLLAANIAEWNAAKTAAETARDADAYANVIGTERSDLATAIATTPESTIDSYEAATTALTTATTAFTAAATNYDALVTEIAKAKTLGIATATANGYAATSTSTAASVLTSTQNLKVAEYNYVKDTYQYSVSLSDTWVDNDGNENTKAATFSNEHWSGTTREYKNQNDNDGQGWNASSWAFGINQDVALPAGNYIFKVAGRCASSDAVTLSLVVKKGEETLGTVSDFPHNGSSARGIDKTGATNFAAADDTYANSNNGFGWEWRYVKFTLAAAATVNVSVNAAATASHMWVSFGDYAILTDDDANVSLIAYNVALGGAQTARDADTYTNVKGTERAALLAAIAADSSVDKTDADAIDAATTALNDATSAFTAAKTNYDALATAITNATAITDAAENVGTALFEHPASAKTTLESATATATSALNNASATSTTAASAAETLNTAITTYNATVNTPDEAKGYTITNTSFEAVLKIADSSVTASADGIVFFTAVTGGYALSNGKGEYVFKTTNDTWTLSTTNELASAYVVSVNIVEGGYTLTGAKGTFGTDATTVGASVYANKKSTNNGIWTIAEAPSIVKTSSANLQGYKTFYNADVNYEVDANTTIYKAAAPNTGYVTLTEVNADRIIPAGTPVILKTSNTTDYQMTLTPTATASENVFDGNVLQVADETGTIDGAYILAYKNPDFGFFQYTGSLDAGDIYLTAPAPAKGRLVITIDGEATGIETAETVEADDNAPAYNVAGQPVTKDYKGIVIKNGKKYLQK